MIFLGIILSIAAIGFFCWLLFTLAVFALPFFAGVTAGGWAYHTGAGWLGAILIGTVAAGLTLGVGQLLIGLVRPLWARLLIALAFVAPAAIAGFHATHGIVKHTMPSETRQVVSRSSARWRSASPRSRASWAWRPPAHPASPLLGPDRLTGIAEQEGRRQTGHAVFMGWRCRRQRPDHAENHSATIPSGYT